jgi:hypothetical protein
MTARFMRPMILVLATTLAVACGSQSSDTDQRIAELEQQLAETKSQMAQTPPQEAAAAPVTTPAAPAAAPASAPARTTPPRPAAAAAPPRPTAPPASQKPAAAQPAAGQPAPDQSAAELHRLAEQQKAVNAKQAEANAQLQQEVDRLKPQEFTLPAGTVVPVRTTTELSTARLSNGSAFDALLERDLTSGGTVLAKAGTRVTGFVVSSDPGGRVKGTASLSVGVRSVVGAKGQVIALTTDSYAVDAASTKKKDAVRTGVATGIGAIIGGLAGGGSGAAIGAGVGAGAGVGVNAATRGEPAVIPAEELIEFRLTSPVTVVITPS